MTQQEFTQRTNVEVSNKEFDAINEVYMNSEVDKDEFCKMWCKMNQKRVKAAIEAEKAQAKKAELKEKAFEVYSAINGICWEDAAKSAEVYLTPKQKRTLNLVGITVENEGVSFPKRVYEIAYELGKYLGITA